MWQFLYLNTQGYPIAFLLVLAAVALKHNKLEGLGLLAVMNVFKAVAGLLTVFLLVEEISSEANQEAERFEFINRISGPYWLAFCFSLLGTTLLPQLFWFKRYRKSPIISLLVAAVPFTEKLIVYATSFHRDYLPSNWSTNDDFGDKVTAVLLYIGLITGSYWMTKRLNRKHGI